MKAFISLFLLLFASTLFAEDIKISLDHVNVNLHDTNSIKRGAQFFATNCMACHTLLYMRYNKIAQAAGILYEKMPLTIKINGVSPPDLSLITRVKSPDWVYTYLHSFYVDTARPTGFNNLVLPNTAMPNLLVVLQGRQILATDHTHFIYHHTPRWFDLLELEKQGSLTPEAYDQTITDLVNFLNYAAAPYRLRQIQLGVWVIGFLIIFASLAYLLKKEYWKNITRRK